MKVVLGMMMLTFALPANYRDSDSEAYFFHLSQGDRFYHSFDNVRALSEYQKAYVLAPDSFATLQRLASIYNDMGRLKLHRESSAELYYRSALAYADSLDRLFPERAESHFWLALCKGSLIPFVGTKEKVEISRTVLTEASRAVEIDSGFALAYVILGIFQREASRMSWIERLIANVVYGAGFSGSLSMSEEYLRKSINLDPANSYGYYELYWTYKAMNDSLRARQALQTLLTLVPRNEREQQQTENARRQLLSLTNSR